MPPPEAPVRRSSSRLQTGTDPAYIYAMTVVRLPHLHHRRLVLLTQMIGLLLLFLILLFSHQSAVPSAHAGETTEPSTLLLHVELPTAALQPSFDRLYDGHLAGRQGPQEWVALGGGTGFIRYQANRRHSALEVHAKEIRSQATIEFSLDYAKPIAGKVTKTADCGVGAGGSQPGRLAVTISSLLTYQRNYSFEPSSRVTSVDVLHPCLLGPDRVNAAPLMAQVYRSRLESMLPALDRSLRETVSFKAKLSDAWARLHAPIQLDESGTMWLLLSPLHTEGLEPASRNGTVSAEVGVVATPRVVMGRKPVLAARPLPALGSRYTERGFHVPFDLDVPYDEANERLRRGLVGQDFGLGPGRIVVRRVKLYPVGKQAGVDIDVDGLITLGVKLRGTPVYDRTTETIGFANVEYEMADQNALTTFADELLHEAVRDELAARLKIPLKGSLEEMRRELESALNREIEGGTLHGKVDRIRLLDVAVGPSALSVRFRTDGELRYHLR